MQNVELLKVKDGEDVVSLMDHLGNQNHKK